MIRGKGKLEARSDYVKRIVAKSDRTQDAVEKLAIKLFTSERTIYRDLAK